MCARRVVLPGTCPTGPAFAAKTTGTDSAHNSVECSNAGLCDTSTGDCKCFSGHTGIACERSTWRSRRRLSRATLSVCDPLTCPGGCVLGCRSSVPQQLLQCRAVHAHIPRRTAGRLSHQRVAVGRCGGPRVQQLGRGGPVRLCVRLGSHRTRLLAAYVSTTAAGGSCLLSLAAAL